MTVLGLVLIGLVGLAVGSFLNVIVHRIPRDESLVRPPSRCPSCATPIRAWHNVPLLSWLVLRGRCAACGGRISSRYPLWQPGPAQIEEAARQGRPHAVYGSRD